MPEEFARKIQSLRQPERDLALDIDGDMVAAAAIGIEPRGEHFGDHADRRAAAMHPAHEQRMGIAVGIGQHRIREGVEQFAERLALLRQGVRNSARTSAGAGCQTLRWRASRR